MLDYLHWFKQSLQMAVMTERVTVLCYCIHSLVGKIDQLQALKIFHAMD